MGPAIFVTGGTGFVGGYVVRELLNGSVDVRLFARSSPESTPSHGSGRVEFISGNVADTDRLRFALRGCKTVIHLVGIIEENHRQNITFESVHTQGTENVVKAALDEGVDKFIYVSANGARIDGVSRYQTTKWAAEEIVRNANFPEWTIFRPSLIFGKPEPGQPEFCSQLIRTLIKPFPVWPVFGSGKYTFRPVHVQDLARAVASAVISHPASNKTYCVAGPLTLTYEEMLDVLGRSVGVNPRPKIHQPLWLSRALVGLMSPTGLLPISPDQLAMLVEGNCCDPSEYVAAFEIQPTSFTGETLAYLIDA